MAHLLYEFWYADPLREIEGLTDEQLFWVPDPNNLFILWRVGQIAHTKRTHLASFLQGIEEPVIPLKCEVFGTRWCSVEEVRRSVGLV